MQIKLKFSKAKLIFLGVGIFVLSFGVVYLVLNWNNVVAQVSGGLKSVIDYFDSRNPGGNPEYYIAQKTNLKVEGGQVKLSLPPEPYLVIYLSTATHDGNFGGRPGLDNFCLNNKPSNLPSNCANCHAFISVNENDEIRDMPENYGYNRNWNIYWWNRTKGKLYMAFSKWADMPFNFVTKPCNGLAGDFGDVDYVWTGTQTWDLSVLPKGNCVGWTTTWASGAYGVVDIDCWGSVHPTFQNATWIGWKDNTKVSCSGYWSGSGVEKTLRVYCICACGL
jgi:hypothetical protein